MVSAPRPLTSIGDEWSGDTADCRHLVLTNEGVAGTAVIARAWLVHNTCTVQYQERAFGNTEICIFLHNKDV